MTKIKSLTIGELREAILDNMISGDEILKKARGMTSEVIAALAKLMGESRSNVRFTQIAYRGYM